MKAKSYVPKVTDNNARVIENVTENSKKVAENFMKLIEKVIEQVAENKDFHHVQWFYLDRVRSRIRTDE